MVKTVLIKKVTNEKEKYLLICGIKVNYKTENQNAKKYIYIGPFRFSYQRINEEGTVYIKIFGLTVNISKLFPDRKQKHYKERKILNDEYCKRLLKKELADGLGYIPNIDEPKSFNEKILWCKFNDRNPLITKCCDKYAVKEYVKEVIGEKYIVPVIAVWKKPEDIDFEALPEKFVLKVNWSSGYNIIVKNKKDINKESIIKQLNKWMLPESNSYYDTFNWGYKYMQPVIYAEKYIEQIDGQVYDYKFFICNGKFEFMFIATDRQEGHLTYTFFDSDFNVIPCTYGNKPNADPIPNKPQNFEKMIRLAENLAKPFPFVRVDFYEIRDEIFIGEMTFYSGGGTLGFTPIEWDYKLGEKIHLPIN